MFYGLAMEENLFKDKVSIFIALAPVTKITNEEAEIFSYLAEYYEEIDNTLKLLEIYELLGDTWLTQGAAMVVCEALPSFC